MRSGPVTPLAAVARTLLAGAAIATAASLSACTSTVAGNAVRDEDAAPFGVPPLKESQLDRVMLSVDDVNSIVGSTDLEVVSEMEEMSDNSRAISDPDCLGVLFGAEEKVYEGSDWTAVRDQVIREPADDKEHWIEQTVVLYPKAAHAEKFFEQSQSDWERCGGFSIAVDDSESSYIWQVDDVVTKGDLISQMTTQEESDGWQCQHALSVVSNVTVETFACAFGVNDEAVQMAHAMVENAAKT